jgi:uncharacterized protein YhjY with autotransporter beta-barrel domain
MHYFYTNFEKNISRLQKQNRDTVSQLFILVHLLQSILRNLNKHAFSLLIILTLGFVFGSEAMAAGNAVTGGTKWVASCGAGGCHNATPGIPQLNAGNAANSSVLDYVITNNFGGAMGAVGAGLTAQDKLDLAAYINSVATPISATVPFGTSATIALKMSHDPAPIVVYSSALTLSSTTVVGSTVSQGTSIAGTSAASGATTSEYTASYTHGGSDCTTDHFTASASGAGGTSSTRTVDVTITAATPNISTSATTSSPAYNTLISIPVTSTGGPIASLAVTSGLSHGGTLTPVGTTSFNYTSNASAYSATDSFTYQATGPCGATSGSVTVNISISVPPAPVITSALTASGSTGNAFSTYTLTANNLPTTINATGLPPGLNFNSATGDITGTPTASGTYNVTLTATNAQGTDTKTLVITISLTAPSITSVLTASGATSVVFGGYTIVATNSPTSFSAADPLFPLPPGLSINNATGVISGTPTLTGTFNTKISATNATATDTKTLVFTISLSATAITSANTASGSTGAAFSYTITASNLPTSFNATGLPPGLGVNAATGAITGTPTSGGVYAATVSATNATNTANLAVTMSITGTSNVVQTVPFNTATAINLSVAGPFTQINIVTPPAHGTAPTPAPASSTVTYTPTTGYFGSDTFTYTATGPGGTSAPSTVTITVSSLIPTAGAGTMTVPLNTATTVDLAQFVTGSGLTGVSVATQGSHGTITTSGATSVTYTPTNNYFGTDTFTYVAYGNVGTSPTPGVITVTVTGRPNPAIDPAVTGLIHAQIDTAKRFTHAQVVNFTGRLESLHRSSTRDTDVASLTPAARVTSTRPVATEKTTSDDSNTQQSGLLQPSINRPNDATQSQPNASVDQSAVFVSTDPMGNDSLTTNSTPKSKQSTLVGKTPTSAVTAMQNSSLNASQGANNPNAAKRLMGDGVRFGVRDLANQTTQQANPLVVLATALSAASGDSSQSATIGKSLTTAMSAIQSSSLNLASSTGTDDGTSALPGGFDYWIGGGVRFGTRDQTSSSNGLDFTTDGISIGADKRINDQFAVGMGVGFGRDKTTIGTDGTNSKAHSATIAAYGSYQPTDGTFIDGVLGYGSLRYTNDRYVQPINDFAHAERSGDHVFTSLTSGYEFRMQGLHLSPYGRLDLAADRLQQSTETGAGAYALTYNSQTIQSSAFTLGLRAETAHTMDFGWALPRMRIEFQHDFKGEPQTSVSYADQPGTSYAITSTTSNQNSILFGLGSDFLLYNGLRLSIDYQMQRSSMHDNSQAMLFKLTKEIGGKAPPPLLLATSGFSLRDWKIRGDAGYTFDDNINRSSTAEERMSDSSYNAELTKSWLVPVTDHTRLVIGSALGGEKFHTYTGLDRMYLSSQAEYQYRASGNFGSPIWGVFTNITGEAYSSTLRDGYRYSGGVSVRKPVTDRINLFSALAHNERHGRSAVFQMRDNSFKLNLDYAATDTSTLYLNTEYRRGDLVSSGSHTLQNIDIAKVFTLDDVFSRNDFYDYRFDGSTALFTLGYNLPFGPKDSIDISWQRVRSAASKSPSVATWPAKHYFDNQLSVVYLFSF